MCQIFLVINWSQKKDRKREKKRERERKRVKEKTLTSLLTAHTHFNFMSKYHSVVKTMDLILLVREVIVWFFSPEASGAITVLYKYTFSKLRAFLA